MTLLFNSIKQIPGLLVNKIVDIKSRLQLYKCNNSWINVITITIT